jgi:hypothetical protein
MSKSCIYTFGVDKKSKKRMPSSLENSLNSELSIGRIFLAGHPCVMFKDSRMEICSSLWTYTAMDKCVHTPLWGNVGIRPGMATIYALSLGL